MSFQSRYASDVISQIRRRDDTDKIMSFPMWALLIFITLGLASLFVIYSLIKRRDDHFDRQHLLQESLVNMTDEMGRNLRRNVSLALLQMKEAHTESTAREERKGALLWMILSIITGGLGGLYVLYFLTEDIGRHDKRQHRFIEGANSAFAQFGYQLAGPRLRLEERPFIVYLIISFAILAAAAIVVGLGLGILAVIPLFLYLVWIIAWYNMIFTDYNEHFKAQWVWEDEVVRAVSAVMPGVPGAPLPATALPPIGAPPSDYAVTPLAPGVSPPPPPPGAPPTGKPSICFGCGATIPAGAAVCPKCGKPKGTPLKK